MATNRIEPGDVVTIYETSKDLTPFIKLSNLIVNKYAERCDVEEDLLFEIERWLAAHYASLAYVDKNEGIVKIEKEGDLQITYATQSGHGFATTIYGQQALALDSCGFLKNLGKNPVKFMAI